MTQANGLTDQSVEQANYLLVLNGWAASMGFSDALDHAKDYIEARYPELSETQMAAAQMSVVRNAVATHRSIRNAAAEISFC